MKLSESTNKAVFKGNVRARQNDVSLNSTNLIATFVKTKVGEILVRSGVATRTYAALDRWVSWLPGTS